MKGEMVMSDPKVELYCQGIDDLFLEYESHKISESTFCKRLANQLHQISVRLNFPKDFEVCIIDGKNEYMGISVYPDQSDLNNVFANLDETSSTKFNTNWLIDIKKYIIEIDKNVFDKTVISFNNKEFTAMLLHELSHVAFSNKKSEIIYNSYKINRATLKFGEKNAVRASQRIMYAIPALIACGMHTLTVGRNGNAEEYICDQIFGIDSYKIHLHNALDKIIKAYGNTIVSNSKMSEQKIDNVMKWCNCNISELSTRRRLIKDDITYQSASTHSRSIRRAYLNVMARLGIGMADKYTHMQVATESVFDKIDSGELKLSGLLQSYTIIDTDLTSVRALENVINTSLRQDIVTESFKSKKPPKLPSDYDIDIISVEIDKIENHYDRMYVLDLIYNKIDQITEFIEYSEATGTYNKYKFKCESQLKALEKLRLAVLDKRTVKNDLRFIVNYPKGYEG